MNILLRVKKILGKKNLFIITVLSIFLLGLLIRLIGTNPGFPLNHPDESIIYGTVIKMVINAQLDPFTYTSYRFQYPGLIPYIHFVFYSFFFLPLYFLAAIIEHPQAFMSHLGTLNNFVLEYVIGKGYINALYWGRYTTAFLSSISILLIYLIGKNMFGKHVGVIAAFLLAISYRHILSSQLSLVDGPSSTFVLLSFYLSYRLLGKPTKINYILAGLGVALSISTKIYIYSLFPFLLSHLLISLQYKTITKFTRAFFSLNFLMATITIPFVFLLTNPFLLSHIETAIRTHTINNIRYGLGSNTLITNPMWYMIDIGIGKLIFLFSILGTIFCLISRRCPIKLIYILLAILPLSIMLLYFSRGGVYVRNFTSVTPFIFLLSAFGLVTLIQKFINSEKISVFILLIAATIISFDPLKNALTMTYWNNKPWNQGCVANWLSNTNEEIRIIRMTSVPYLPKKNISYIDPYTTGFDRRTPFSLSELQETSYADYIAINYFYNQYYFLWWVGGNKYLDMPVNLLDNTYESLVFKELSRYSALDCQKPWPSLDNNYSIIKIPTKKTPSQLSLYKTFTFGTNTLNSSSCKENGCIQVKQRGRDEKPYFISLADNIPTEENTTYVISAWISAEKNIPEKQRDGFIRVDFYSEKNAGSKRGIIASVSPRYFGNGWQEKKLQITSPKNARFMKISFQEHDMLTTFFIDDLKIFRSMEEPSQEEIKNANNKEVDNLILYPASVL